MAIGTAAAIGLGVAGIGSALGARSQSKAAGKAADVSLEVAEKNNALARDIYGQNKAILNPYVERGNAAGNTINALLGLGGTPAQTTPATPGTTPTPGTATMGTPNVLAQFQGPNPDTSSFFGLSNEGGNMLPADRRFAIAAQNGLQWPMTAQNMGTTAVPQGTTPSVPAVSAQQAANDAFDIFKNSTGYQFRVNEGNRALNSGWAGAGTLQSGAAMRAAQEFGQNIASQEFGNYMGYLGNQQGVGLGAGSALAGVGQNYVNTISANNNNAGSAAANAALVKGANNPFASILGTIGGGILGRGF